MKFIAFFSIAFAVLEALATGFSVALVRGGSVLTFKEVWLRQQLLPVVGGLFVGLVAYLF